MKLRFVLELEVFIRDDDGVIKISEVYSDSTVLNINGKDEVCIKNFFSTPVVVGVVLIVDDNNEVYIISTKSIQEFINFSDRRPKYDWEDVSKLAHRNYNLKELYCRGRKVSIFSFVD